MRPYSPHLRYVFRLEDEMGKSHKLLSTNAFKAQGVDFEFFKGLGRELLHGQEPLDEGWGILEGKGRDTVAHGCSWKPSLRRR